MPEGSSGQGQKGRPLKAPTPPQDNKIEHHRTPRARTSVGHSNFPTPGVLIYKVGVQWCPPPGAVTGAEMRRDSWVCGNVMEGPI